MDLLAELNPAQKEAVRTTEGPVLALAGPGSGKTRALTHRIAYLVQAGQVAPWHIVAVTFTNKAAREMKSRLEEMLTSNQAHNLHMGTFHALCARLLRREIEVMGRYDRNFVIYDTDDQRAVVKRAVRDLDLDDKRWKPTSIHYAISNAKNEMITPANYPTRTYPEEITARVYERYQQILQENNALDFDDLLLVTHRLFRRHEPVLEKYQEQYRHVLIDEFQDTNMVQYELAKMLAGGHGNIFVVGDLDQSIYSWRGADYRNVLRFREDYPNHKLILLSQNYRSTETILQAARQVIRKNQNRIDNELFTERGEGIRIRLVEAYNEYEEATFVVDEILRLERDEGISPGEVAIMYRTNAQSRVLEETFIKRDMPYLLVRGTRFYDRREIKDALAYLRFIHNPRDSVSLERIINLPPRGIGSKTITGLSRWALQLNLPPWEAIEQLMDEAETAVPHPFRSRAYNALVNFGELMSMLINAAQKLTLPELFDLALARTGYKGHIKDNTPEGEERWENLQELRRKTEQSPEPGSLGQFLEEVALVADVDALVEAGEAPALLTLHTAKGLEFAVVFIVGMEEGLFPHSRSMGDREQMEEERRLAYVGITRAKDRLYLVRAFRRSTYGYDEPALPSRFLDDIPRDLIDDGQPRKKSKKKKSRPAEPVLQSRPDPKPSLYQVGDRVHHNKFGDGVVIKVREDDVVEIAFPDVGIKKLAVNIAPLEKRP